MNHSMSRPFRKHVPPLFSHAAPDRGNRDRPQTAREELLNVITHGLGALLAAAGTAVLVVRAVLHGSALAVVSAALYGASLIFLYTASTLYHAARDPAVKRRRRVWDHCSIFLLILGTYIPLSLVTIGGALGWTLFAVNATLAVVGVVSRVVTMSRGKSHLSVALYLIMGWLVILAIRPVIQAVPPAGLALLVAGGLSYTAGVWFYRNKGPYMHVIWHLFVLAGSVFHYVCVLLCCCG